MKPVLFIVDMQKYYLWKNSDFHKYCTSHDSLAMTYINFRCNKIVIPNIQQLLRVFRSASLPVFFLKLCSEKDDRSDLHLQFQESHQHGKSMGFEDVYPACTSPFAEIIDELKPMPDETIICKSTFSPFTFTNIQEELSKKEIDTIFFTGLATSQCVETTARDASERGFRVIQVEDAQADYSETLHRVSLLSSKAVCGGEIYETNEICKLFSENQYQQIYNT